MPIPIEIEIGSLLVDAELIDEAAPLARALPFESPFEERDGALMVASPVPLDIVSAPTTPPQPGRIAYLPDTRTLALVMMPAPFLAQVIGRYKCSPDELQEQAGEILIRFQSAD